MIRGKLLAGTFVAAFAVAAVPAWAQRGSAERADPDSRATGPSSSGATGTAVDRGSSGSSTSSGSSPSAGSSSTSESGRASSPGSSWTPSSGSSRGEYVSAPTRPSDRAERASERGQRSRGGESTGGDRRPSGASSSGGSRAVPRGSDGGDRATGSTASTSSADSGRSDAAPERRAVPTYSRPRDGRTATGTAVDRQYPLVRNPGYSSSYYVPYYSQYYWPGYGYGLGLGYYDPLWYDPFSYGGGGYYGGGGGGYYGGYSGGYGYGGTGSYPRNASGNLRLKIKPRDAQVFVDGFFVGVVDSFDGVFQKLGIDAGGHRIEIKAPGHEPIQFDVLIAPGETVTYRGELRRIQ
jgi:hypothetical protein